MPYRSKYNLDEGDLLTGTRVCRLCEKRYPITDYSWTVTRKSRVRVCRQCNTERTRQRRAMQGEEYKDRERATALRRNYGITITEWNQLMELQQHQCAICKKALTRINTHVDHCHDSNMVRGLLCFECNTGIGKFHDNVDWLLAAVAYLRAPHPQIQIRDKHLSPLEKSEIRVAAAIKWHQSDKGRERTRQRALEFSGERNSFSKLTNEQAAMIIERYSAGDVTQSELAAEYNVSQTLINAIILGKVRSVNGEIRRNH